MLYRNLWRMLRDTKEEKWSQNDLLSVQRMVRLVLNCRPEKMMNVNPQGHEPTLHLWNLQVFLMIGLPEWDCWKLWLEEWTGAKMWKTKCMVVFHSNHTGRIINGVYIGRFFDEVFVLFYFVSPRKNDFVIRVLKNVF